MESALEFVMNLSQNDLKLDLGEERIFKSLQDGVPLQSDIQPVEEVDLLGVQTV